MKKFIPVYFLLLGLVVFYACKKVNDIPDPLPSNELEVKVQPYFGTSKLYLDSIYTTDDNYLIQFEEIRFYMTYLGNGSNSLIDVAFFNYRQKGNSFFKIIGEAANFSQLSATLGVDSLRNHADPSGFSSSNPLNIMIANDMHWGWNPGYIFIYIDAKVDTIPDGTTNLDHFVSYHIGGDSYKQSLNFTTLTWTKTSSTLSTANLNLDLKKFLLQPQIINLKSENISHTDVGQEVLSQKAITNFANALSFQ